MAMVKHLREAGPGRPGLGHTIRSWWMLMAEASLGEDLAIMAETGLTLPQVLTLFKLHDQSPQCVSSIAAVLHLSQPATSQLLDRLVQEGLVDRTEDPGDRRRKRLAITPRPRPRCEQAEPEGAREARFGSPGGASPAGATTR
jgi:DNA-binding MarR family transcriptional regulator